MINSDGSGLRYFEFDVPNQATWQPGPLFSDGKRIVFLSMEPRRDGPGKPFEEYYTQTPTHIWAHDLVSGSLEELCTKDRIAPFETPALLIGDDRLLVQVVKNKVGQIVSMNLDGTDVRDFTKPGEGLPYGLSLRHDGKRVAFHLASPQGYQVWTSDLNGENRVKIKGEQGHIFFGTSWSPDGQWILYVDCIPGSDPGHDWCDVCIGKADGSEHRTLTDGMAMWFAATYGPPNAQGRRVESAGVDGGRKDSVSAADSRLESALGIPGGKTGSGSFQPGLQASGFTRRREYLSTRSGDEEDYGTDSGTSGNVGFSGE